MGIEFGLLKIKNLGCIGQAHLDLGAKGINLILGQNLDTGAANSNGSGKSTIFRALTWVLYGQGVEGGKFDFVRKDSNQVFVSINLRISSKRYFIERTQKGERTPSLIVTEEGKRISPRSIRETQEMINKLIGLDWLSFKNTILYGQGDISHFADPRTTDSQRKAILSKILGLEKFEQARKYSREKLRSIQNDGINLENQIDRLEGLIEGLQLDWWQSKEEDWINEHKQKIQDLQQDLVDLHNQKRSLESTQRRLEAYEKRFDQVQEVLDGLEETTKRREEKALELAYLEGADLRNLEAEENIIWNRIQSLQEEMDRFKEGKCPTCSTPTDQESVLKTIGGIKRKMRNESKNLEIKQKEIGHHRSKILETKRIIEKIDKELEEIDDWEEKQLLISSKIREIEEELSELANIETEIKHLQLEIEDNENKKNPYTDKINEVCEKGKMHEEQLYRLRRGTKLILQQIDNWKFWVEGFGPGGIPSYLLDSVVPVITEKSNRYLEILADGDISIKMDTLSELKSGAVKDKLSINTTIEGNQNVTPSGGQLRKITLACDLALMDIVAQREGTAIDLLLMDEVLDGLDATGRSRIMDLLTHLKKQRGTIFLVTHDPELLEFMEKFDRIINVTKQDGVSDIRIE